MAKKIYFQASLNDVHIAYGVCESIESLNIVNGCSEVRFFARRKDSNFIVLYGIGLEVKYRFDDKCGNGGVILGAGEFIYT